MAGGYQLFETTFIFGKNQFKKSGLFDPEEESAMIFRKVRNNLPNGETQHPRKTECSGWSLTHTSTLMYVPGSNCDNEQA
jgi:muramidase (phage lysozyme)